MNAGAKVDCIEKLAYNLSSVVKTETGGMNWDQWDQADMELKPDNWRTDYFDAKGRVAVPNRMNFRENSNTAFDPPLVLGKLCCKFFMMVMVAYMQGGMMEPFFVTLLRTFFGD